MYTWYQYGTTSLINNLQVYQSIYRNSFKSSTLISVTNKGVIGSSTQPNLKNSIKAATGEHIERTALYLSEGKSKVTTQCFNLVSGEVKRLEVSPWLLTIDTKIKEQYENYYNDSCGVASHLSSEKALNKAFLEFFERQSLIINWLTQTKGQEISQSYLSSNIQRIINNVHSFIDKIYLFNISINSRVYVILCMGVGKSNVGIGLSADWDLNSAVYGSLVEMTQFFSGKKNKKFMGKKETTKFNTDLFNDPHYFSHKFISEYDSNKILEEYSYLFDKSRNNLLVEEDATKKVHSNKLSENLKHVSESLGINIFAIYIPTFLDFQKTKIVKVFSDDAFPHMNTEILEPTEYRITKNLRLDNFPNYKKCLPFP